MDCVAAFEPCKIAIEITLSYTEFLLVFLPERRELELLHILNFSHTSKGFYGTGCVDHGQGARFKLLGKSTPQFNSLFALQDFVSMSGVDTKNDVPVLHLRWGGKARQRESLFR